MANRGDRPVMLYDGRCLFCNAAVRFVIRHEKAPVLVFAALQSKGGSALLRSSDLPVAAIGKEDDISSFVIVENGVGYRKFAACLKMFEFMGGLWAVFGKICWLLVPRFVGNACYDLGWRYRYLIMGKEETCIKPTPTMKARIILDGDTFD